MHPSRCNLVGRRFEMSILGSINWRESKGSGTPLVQCLQKINLSFNEGSSPSKVQWFLSFQMHHMRQDGAAPHTSPLLRVPRVLFQDSNKARTELGITQVIPTRRNKNSHNSLAIGQLTKDGSPILYWIYTYNTNL